MTVWGVVAAALLIAAMVWQRRRRHIRSIPDTPDLQFGEYFHENFGIDPSAALAERTEISKLIGVPKEKLGPQTRFAELISGSLDSTQIGLTDLEFDLSALAKKSGMQGRIEMPGTVAEVVRLRMKLKADQL